MKCCEKCFVDKQIKDLFINITDIGKCDICKSKQVKVLEMKNENLKYYFEALLDVYIPTQNISEYVETKGELVKNILKNDWYIFNSKLTSEKIEIFLREIFPERKSFFNQKVTTRFSEKDQKLCIVPTRNWEDFTNEIKEINRFHIKNFNLENFSYFLSRISSKLKKNFTLYRGRICLNEEGYKLEDMGAPPKKLSKNGRLNPEGISCLYLAEDKDTVLLESRAIKHDFITIGKFNLQKDIDIIDLTLLNKISPFFDLENILKQAINQNILKDIVKEISKPKRKLDSSLDYLPSEYISEYIKSLGYEGIKYKSTLKSNGINYAIFNEENFKCEEVKTYEVKEISHSYENVNIE